MTNTGLTKPELDILRLKASGFQNQDIAVSLFIWPSTVKTHIRHILHKLRVYNIVSAVVIAIRDGDLDPNEILIAKKDCTSTTANEKSMAIGTLGDILIEVRRHRRLKQVDLAKLVGISRNWISMIERDKANITLDVLCRLSSVLCVEVGTLAEAYQLNRK